jgi:hypothetical protein
MCRAVTHGILALIAILGCRAIGPRSVDDATEIAALCSLIREWALIDSEMGRFCLDP